MIKSTYESSVNVQMDSWRIVGILILYYIKWDYCR